MVELEGQAMNETVGMAILMFALVGLALALVAPFVGLIFLSYFRPGMGAFLSFLSAVPMMAISLWADANGSPFLHAPWPFIALALVTAVVRKMVVSSTHADSEPSPVNESTSSEDR